MNLAPPRVSAGLLFTMAGPGILAPARRLRPSGAGLWQQWGCQRPAGRAYRPVVAAWTKQTLQDHFFKEAKVGGCCTSRCCC